MIHRISSFNHTGMDTARSASSESSAVASRFPTDPAEFGNDERISWSKLDNSHILETEDGQEFVFDTSLKRWVLQVGDRLKPGMLGFAINQMRMRG